MVKFEYQRLKKVDLPIIIINTCGELVWHNDAVAGSSFYNKKSCKYINKDRFISNTDAKHCSIGSKSCCLIKRILEDYFSDAVFNKRVYNCNNQYWDINIKHIDNGHIIVYFIECTSQKIANLLYEKHTKGIKKSKQKKTEIVEKNFILENNYCLFKELFERLFIPVIIFNNSKDVVYFNKSLLVYFENYIDKLIKVLSLKLESFDSRKEDVFEYYIKANDNFEKEVDRCVVHKIEETRENKYYAIILNPKNLNISNMSSSNNKCESSVLSILYVEDKPINQKVFSIMLEKYGCKVDIADNGEDGVEMAKKNEYNLIFMDLQMPVMNGFESAKRINEIMDNPPPIIAVTAYHDIIEERELSKNGIVDVVSKPYNSKEIFDKLVYWMQQS